MKNEMISKFQEVLMNLKMELVKQGRSSSKLLKTKSGNEVDRSLNDQLNTLDLKIVQRQHYYEKKLQDALDRLKDGTFGKCEECDSDISEGRLLARPTATMCINCKDESERAENNILYHKRSHTLGKEINNENVISMEIFKDDIQYPIKSSNIQLDEIALVN